MASLPYSVFIDQVKADNVDRVAIAGGEIKGSFKQPVAWRAKRYLLDRLARALLEHETVDHDELARLLGPPAATATAA